MRQFDNYDPGKPNGYDEEKIHMPNRPTIDTTDQDPIAQVQSFKISSMPRIHSALKWKIDTTYPKPKVKANMRKIIQNYDDAIDRLARSVLETREDFDINSSEEAMDARRFWQLLASMQSIRTGSLERLFKSSARLKNLYAELISSENLDIFQQPLLASARCLPSIVGFPLFNIGEDFDNAIPQGIKEKLPENPIMFDVFKAIGREVRNELRIHNRESDSTAFTYNDELFKLQYQLLQTAMLGTLASQNGKEEPLSGAQINSFFAQQLIGDINTGLPVQKSPFTTIKVDSDYILGISSCLTRIASDLVSDNHDDFKNAFSWYKTLTQVIPDFDFYFAMGLCNSALNNPKFDLVNYIQEVFDQGRFDQDEEDAISKITGRWAGAIQDLRGTYIFNETLIKHRFLETPEEEFMVDTEKLPSEFEGYKSDGTEEVFENIDGLLRFEINNGDTEGFYYLDLSFKNKLDSINLEHFPYYIQDNLSNTDSRVRVAIIVDEEGNINALPSMLIYGEGHTNFCKICERTFSKAIKKHIVEQEAEEAKKTQIKKSAQLKQSKTNTSRPAVKTQRRKREESTKEVGVVRKTTRYNPVIVQAPNLQSDHMDLVNKFNKQSDAVIIKKLHQLSNKQRKIYELRPLTGGGPERVLLELRAMDDGSTRFIAFSGFYKGEQADIFKRFREN